MFRKKTGDYLDKCSILLHGYKLFAVLLLAFGMAACDDDNTVPEPDPEPTSTFKLHIGEGNIVPMDLGAPDNYPPAYMAVLVMFLNWDWEKEPLYWRCLYLLHPLPGTTYYVRGYVQTNKAEYYSNTVEIRSSLTAPVAENPDAYEIPVIFHLFPDAEGNYPVKDWMVPPRADRDRRALCGRHHRARRYAA